MKHLLFNIVFFILATPVFAQNVVWIGTANGDFFDEANWVIEGTLNPPPAGSVDENVTIDLNLVVTAKDFIFSPGTSLSFSAGKGLTLIKSSVDLGSLQSGYVRLADEATLVLRSTDPLGADALLELDDNRSWVKLMNVGATDAAVVWLSKVTVNGHAAVADENILVNQYYFKGSLLRSKDPAFKAMTLFDGTGQGGESFGIVPHQIYSRDQLGAFENKASSLRLERGYQAVLTIYQNGTGKSETIIALEEPLIMDLPRALNNAVSFVRVMPWNWVTKKGASKFVDIGNTWTYNWGNNAASLPEMEYAPMSWGTGGATLSAIGNYIKMEKVTHVLGFNESDNCNGQSGQYNNLCDINVAVPLFENLMRTGLRLVSPSPRENGPFTWLKDFRNLAVEKDIRYDVLGVHWYDWGSNPANTPFEDPVKIFNRFRIYLNNVYAEHKMPIWITEFNANPNRDASVHKAFLELALPYLESLSFVERYDYFEPMKENAGNRTDIAYGVFFDDQGNITPLGEFYRDFASTPSISAATYTGSGLLAGIDNGVPLSMQANKSSLAEGETLTLTFTTARPVGAPENFDIQLNLDAEQYELTSVNVSIPEGGTTAQVTLTAVDDALVEELMTATVTLGNISGGLEWDNKPLDITISSDDEEVVLGAESETELIRAYPNPTQRFIRINVPSDAISWAITSIDGRQFDSARSDSDMVDLEGVSAGIYLLRVVLENGKTVSRRVVKH